MRDVSPGTQEAHIFSGTSRKLPGVMVTFVPVPGIPGLYSVHIFFFIFFDFLTIEAGHSPAFPLHHPTCHKLFRLIRIITSKMTLLMPMNAMRKALREALGRSSGRERSTNPRATTARAAMSTG